MSETKDEQEPSMEEILASIRRIIADDPDPAAATAEAPPAPEDDILELTEIVPDESEAEVPVQTHPAETHPIEARPVEIPPPEAPVSEPPYLMPLLSHDDRIDPSLVSEETAIASMTAFASVAAEARRRLARDQPIGTHAVTLEDMVKELLRPMLKEWLDAHLPDLVAKLVGEEIERLSRNSK